MRVPIGARRAAAGAALFSLAITITGGPIARATDTGSPDDAIVAEALTRATTVEDLVVWASPSGNGQTIFLRTKARLLDDLTFTDRFRIYGVDVVTRQIRVVSEDGSFDPQAVSYDGRIIIGALELEYSKHALVALDTVTGSMHPFDLPEPLTFLRQATISTDGTTVALTGTTGSGETLSPNRLFIADVASGAVTEPFAGADGELFDAYVNHDGTIVAVSSYAENLDMPLGSVGSDAIVYDRVAGTLEYAHVTTDGGVPDDQSTVAGMSSDGRFVFVRSWASNFPGSTVEPGTYGSMQLYRFDRETAGMDRLPTQGDESGDTPTVVFSPNGSRMVSLGQIDGQIDVVDVDSWQSHPLAGEEGPFVATSPYASPAGFDESGELLVFVAADSTDATGFGGIFRPFAIGLPPADPSADPYVPGEVVLPPAIAGGNTGPVVPLPTPSVDPQPPTTVDTPAPGPDDPTPRTTCLAAWLGATRPGCGAEYVVGYLVRTALIVALAGGEALGGGNIDA